MPTTKKENKVIPLNPVEKARALNMVVNEIISRTELSGRLGQSYFSGSTAKRDLYHALGWIKTPTYEDYYLRWKRDGIGRRVINAFPDATWSESSDIEVSEDEGNETEFEKGWKDLVKQRRLYQYILRADRLSGVGKYAVLLLGFNDGEDLSKEIVDVSEEGENKRELLYVMPYSEQNASIHEWNTDSQSERYGLPETYRITMKSLNRSTSISKIVHWSRVIHIAEGRVEDDVYGTPRLEDILNNLMALELIVGGDSEMFWRGAFPGLALSLHPDADIDKQTMSELQDEVEKYQFEMQRYLRLIGMEVKELSPNISDPTSHMTSQLKIISGAKGIPMRILIGSERGQLASTQDESSWKQRVKERRETYAEPMILRPLIDRFIRKGVIPSPKDEYVVSWPDLFSFSEKEIADIAKVKTEALTKYAESMAASDVMPLGIFLEKILNLSVEEVKEIEDRLGEMVGEDIIDEEEINEEENIEED